MDQSRIKQIHYYKGGTSHCIDLEKKGSDNKGRLLSTIPINDLIFSLEGHPQEGADKLLEAAKGLDYVAEVFLYLNINKPNIFDVPLLYFSGNEYPFNRIYDVGIFSRKMVPAGKNALCLEISCNNHDETWTMDDDTLFEKCIVPLEKNNLLDRSEVESYHTRRMTHAYPRFRVGYEKRLKVICDYVGEIPNLVTFGRQGLFSYANVDDVIWMGFQVAKHVGYCDRIKLPMKELLPNYIAF